MKLNRTTLRLFVFSALLGLLSLGTSVRGIPSLGTELSIITDLPNSTTNFVSEGAAVVVSTNATNFSGTLSFIPITNTITFKFDDDTVTNGLSTNLFLSGTDIGDINHQTRIWSVTTLRTYASNTLITATYFTKTNEISTRGIFIGDGSGLTNLPASYIGAAVTNSATVVITNIAVAEPVTAATWTASSTVSDFVQTNGVCTYTGTETIVVTVNAHIVFDPATGNNRDLSLFVAKNGVVDLLSEAPRININSGDPTPADLTWLFSVSTSDTIEIFVQNKTAAVNIAVTSAQIEINR